MSSAAIAVRASGPLEPVEAPWTTRSRARRTLSTIVVRVASVWPRKLRPSEALRACWLSRASWARSRIASLVPVGESEGRLMSRPVEICSWLRARRAIPVCSEESERSTISRWVIRGLLISVLPSG